MLTNRPTILTSSFWNLLGGFVLTGAASSIWFQESPGGCGDYPQNFQVLFQGMGIGAAVFLLYYAIYPKVPHAHVAQPLLLTVIKYFLAYTILGYGYAKVFAGQFPHTMANMDARFVELTPMRVAWAFFGYSKGYQEFLGWAEVIPALLLFFRRTTLLGAILMFTVMLNVFLINIFFDVCVKLNSGIYTVLALYIMMQSTSRLWTFFFTNRVTMPASQDNRVFPRWLKISGMVLNYGALIYILYLTGEGAYYYYDFSQQHVTPTPVQGPWRTVDVKLWKDGQWQSKDQYDSLYANRLFFDGLNGVIKSDLIRDRFRFSVDSTGTSMTVRFTNLRNEWNIDPVTWKFERPVEDSLKLWVKWKSDSLMLNCVLRKERLTRY